MNLISPFHSSAAFHAETNRLIFSASKVISSCMEYNTGLKLINELSSHVYILQIFNLR